MMKIVIDQNKCLGCGTCVAIAPKTFKLGKNGKSEVINEQGDPQSDIQNAASSCPVGAIKLKENSSD